MLHVFYHIIPLLAVCHVSRHKEVPLWCTTQLYFDRRRLEDVSHPIPPVHRPFLRGLLLIEMLLLPADADADSDVCLLCLCSCPSPPQYTHLAPCRLSVRCLLLLSVVMFWAGTYTILALAWRLPLQLQLAMFVRLSVRPLCPYVRLSVCPPVRKSPCFM